MSKRTQGQRHSTSSVDARSRSDSNVTSNPSKYFHLDGESAFVDTGNTSITCSLPPHPHMKFPNASEYEVHYNQDHVNRCLTCFKNFPSEHYLGLHIAENHDPIKELKKENGEKIFACFVEDCEKVCSAPYKRRLHCLAKHNFPEMYDFFIVNDGLDKRCSMLRPAQPSKARSRKISTGSKYIPEKAEAAKPSDNSNSTHGESDIENVASKLSGLSLVPNKIRFGKRGQAGFSRQTDIIDES